MESKTCSTEDCTEPIRSKGLCDTHYQREQYRLRRLRQGLPAPAPAIRNCDVCGAEFKRAGRRVLYCGPECREMARRIRGHVRDYGLTKTGFHDLLVKQQGVCAICQNAESGRKQILSVDHDHTTGHVRGLLCHSCNVGLGHFKDDPELLARAVAYLGATTV